LALIIIACAMPAFCRQSGGAITLSAVKTIFVPVEPPIGREKSEYWSNPDNADFQDLLFRSLVKWRRAPKNDPHGRKWLADGNCATGIATIIPDVKLVCEQNAGDVELLGYVAGDPREVTSTTGTISGTGSVDASGTIDAAGVIDVDGTISETGSIDVESVTHRTYQFNGGALMFDLRTNEQTWQTTKGGANAFERGWYANQGGPNETPADVAGRIVDQLRKDILSARKSGPRRVP
jgi:hypothetical protein